MTGSRSSASWGSEEPVDPPEIDVLIPTAGRVAELAVTLAGLAAQDDPAFRVVLSDQADRSALAEPAVSAMLRVLRAQGHEVRTLRHVPRRGLAEQRDFLLGEAEADAVLFLDDDVWLEAGRLRRMHEALAELRCGFVGMAVQGLSYLDDQRPDEWESFERWETRVAPELVARGTPAFERWRLHNAANLTHLARRVPSSPRGWTAYKVAWIGGCVLYRTAALRDVGGFSFWPDLPERHSGEDVLAQWRVMAKYGGAGILPSGAVHLEAPTTIPVRDVEAYDIAG